MDEIPEVIRVHSNRLGGFYLFFNLPDGRLTFWVICKDQNAKDELDAWSKFREEWNMEGYSIYKQRDVRVENARTAQNIWNSFEGEL
jgi:hypothetical protein